MNAFETSKEGLIGYLVFNFIFSIVFLAHLHGKLYATFINDGIIGEYLWKFWTKL